MHIPKDIIDKYSPHDADTNTFLTHFDEPITSRIIEIGSHDETVSNMLSETGFNITGIDLREYDKDLPPCNYPYIRCDFNDLPESFMKENWGKIDTIIALSCIEHFGMNTYSEGSVNLYYDVLAMHRMRDLLKEGGTIYLTVPFGSISVEFYPHWRVYNKEYLYFRLVQDFTVEQTIYFFSANWWSGLSDGFHMPEFHDLKYDVGDIIDEELAMTFPGGQEHPVRPNEVIPPNLTVFLKLRKKSIKRLAPDGR